MSRIRTHAQERTHPWKGLLGLLVVCALFGGMTPLFSAALRLPAADVAFTVKSLEADADTFSSLVSDVIEAGLTEKGLVAVPLDVSAETSDAGAAPVVLTCSLSAAGSKLTVSLAWKDGVGGTDAVQGGTGPLDVHMDRVVLTALNGLLATVSSRVEELAAGRAAAVAAAKAAADAAEAARARAAAQAREAATAAAPAAAPAETPAVAASAPVPAAAQATGTTASVSAAIAAPASTAPGSAPPNTLEATTAAPVSAPAAGAPVGTAAPAGTPAAPARFEFRAGAAAFLPFGPAAEYFTAGVVPSVTAAYDFPLPPGRLALGLGAASVIFSAVGPKDTALAFLVPIGPDARYTVGTGAPLTAWAHVAVGPALIVLTTQSQGTITDLTAFLRSGFGVGFSFGARFTVEVTADYEMYFEQPWMIMGITTSLLATVRP